MDFLVFQRINDLAGKSVFLDGLAVFFAEYLGYILVGILVFFLLKDYRKYWQFVLKVFLAAFFARFVIVEIIRSFWERPRPFVENQVNLLISHEVSGSFPSGHAAFYFALAIAIYYFNKKLGIFFLISSFLISFFRVFSGVHWPSDVLAGAIVGIFSGWLITRSAKKI